MQNTVQEGHNSNRVIVVKEATVPVHKLKATKSKNPSLLTLVEKFEKFSRLLRNVGKFVIHIWKCYSIPGLTAGPTR